MVNFDDEVTVKWHPNNKEHYTSLGYKYTGNGKEFMVKIKDLSKGSSCKIPVVCDLCGNTFYKIYRTYTTMSNHNIDACNDCKTIKSHMTQIDNNQENIINKMKRASDLKGYKLILDKDKQYTMDSNVKYECGKHGIQTSLVGNYINGHGCYYCARELVGKKTKHSTEKLIEVINSHNDNVLLNPEDYKDAHTKNLNILCGLCKEHIFTTCYDNYIRSTYRCEYCCNKMSNGEFTIRKILDAHNIEYDTEKTFSDCRDKQTLPFDFYLSKYNLCIEFDGEQHFNSHYYETMFKDKDKAIETFKKEQEHDKIKNDYCRDNQINLLRIPYWEEKYLEEIILNEIKSLNKRYSLIS